MKRHAPAALRNREAILSVLSPLLGEQAAVLEVASGSGEHALHFASRRPGWRFRPSDRDDAARASIEAYRAEAMLPNLLPPLALDMCAPWHHPPVDLVLCINMIHISPWEATVGLMRGAAATLGAGGILVTYGPYCFGGAFTAESNRDFDRSLRERDPSWGVRDEHEITRVAGRFGFERERVVALPANNHALVYRRNVGDS